LPEAILGVDITLSKEEVWEVLGVDVRNAQGITIDLDGLGETGEGEGAIQLREAAGSEEGSSGAEDRLNDGIKKWHRTPV
jgi:hypothetical protein